MVALVALAVLAQPGQFGIVDPPADSSLRNAMDLWVTARPLDEILKALAKITGRRMRLDSSARTGPLSVYVKQEPASAIMKNLAQGFDLVWVRAGDTLFLSERADFHRMRQAFLADQEAKNHAELLRKLEFWAHSTADPDELKARHQRLAERQRAEAMHNDGRRKDFFEEEFDLGETERPPGLLVASMVSHMSADDRRRLVDGQTIVGGTHPAPGIADLRDVATQIAEWRRAGGTSTFKAALVAIRYDPGAGQVRMLLHTDPPGQGQSVYGDNVSVLPRPNPDPASASPPFLARFQPLRVDYTLKDKWPSLASIKVTERAGPAAPKGLEEFARLTGCPVIAEASFSRAAPWGSLTGDDAAQLLRQLTRGAPAYVRVQGRWVVVRPDDFWRLQSVMRFCSAPEPYGPERLASADAALDALARVCADARLPLNYGEQQALPPWLSSLTSFSPSFLRLWQTLLPDQRKSALGTGLPASSLSTDQRSLFSAAKRDEYMRSNAGGLTVDASIEMLRDDRLDKQMLWILARPYHAFFVHRVNGSGAGGPDPAIVLQGPSDVEGTVQELTGWSYSIGFRPERPRFPASDLQAAHLAWQGSVSEAIKKFNLKRP